MKKTILLLLIGILATITASAGKIDSLRMLLQKAPDPVSKTTLLYELGDAFHEADSALIYFDMAKVNAEAHQDSIGAARYASHVIPLLNSRGKYREALALALDAADKYQQLNSPENLGIAYLNIGNEWQYLSDFKTASEYYLKAKKIADRITLPTLQRRVNNNLASVFISMEQFDKGIAYAELALEIAQTLDNKWNLISPLYNLGVAYNYQKKPQKALEYFYQVEQLGRALNDEEAVLDALLGIGNSFAEIDPAKGVSAFDSVIFAAQKSDLPLSELYGYMGKANLYMVNEDYTSALNSIDKGIPLAKTLEARFELIDLYKKASATEEKLGNWKQALAYNRAWEALNEEVVIEKNKNEILNLEAKYRFERKEIEIKSLNAEKIAQHLLIKQKNSLNYGLAIALLLLFTIAYMVYRNYIHKAKLQKQRISELETEKRFQASGALLRGQEEERSRMAKDLHDGLGGLLSGVKINLSNMKKKLIITEEDGAAFEKSLVLLDTSIQELRRVAHNLMPESIIKLGLDGALRSFLESLTTADIQITYQSYNIATGINKQLDIVVYRLVQELVNNILKHAGATEALVQVRKDEALLLIDVEDNGIGFNPQGLTGKSGMGIAGTQARVAYWKGTYELESAAGEGTNVHIEIPI